MIVCARYAASFALIVIHFPGLHHNLACLRPRLHLHDQSSDNGPHEGHVKAVNAELKEVHQEAEKVCQGISGGKSGKVQGGLAEENLTQAGALLSTFMMYPICQQPVLLSKTGLNMCLVEEGELFL